MVMRGVSNIICSSTFTVLINSDQNVISFGGSSKGAHGQKEEYVFHPKIISSLNQITLISAGKNHCACLDNDGNVFTFGGNKYGQLGIGVDKDTLEFTHIHKKSILLLAHKFLVVIILQCA